MAITLQVAPAKFNAVFRNIPINVEVSSTQFGTQSFSASAVADNGSGFCRYTIGAHVILVDGVITGSAFAPVVQYNVRQKVTAVAATTIDTDLAFVSNDTGTITRSNDNFQIRAEIRQEPGSVFIGDKITTRIDVGGSDRFRFNPANLLTSVLSHDIEAVGFSILQTPTDNSITGYSIKFIEEFNDKDGLLQQFATLTISTANAVNATRQYLDSDQTLDEFVGDATPDPTNKFLTNAPLSQKIALAEEVQLSFIFDVPGDARQKWERYKTGDILHDTQTGVGVTPSTFRMTLPVNSSLFDIATLPNVTRIVVWIEALTGLHEMTEKRTFVLDKRPYDNPVRFWFLNKLGGFDSFTFTGHRKETVRSKRTSFQQSLGISFNIKDRGLSTLAVNNQFLREVFSDFLNEEHRIWLTELFTSPEVYIQEGTSLIPIVTTTTQIQFIRDGKLTQLRIQYEMPKHIIQTN